MIKEYPNHNNLPVPKFMLSAETRARIKETKKSGKREWSYLPDPEKNRKEMERKRAREDARLMNLAWDVLDREQERIDYENCIGEEAR